MNIPFDRCQNDTAADRPRGRRQGAFYLFKCRTRRFRTHQELRQEKRALLKASARFIQGRDQLGINQGKRISFRLRERFPVGTAAILADDLQVKVRLSGDTLTIATCNDFARNMVDRPDVLANLGELASEIAGRPISVQSTAPDAPEMQRSAAEINERLEALRQFGIVQFK